MTRKRLRNTQSIPCAKCGGPGFIRHFGPGKPSDLTRAMGIVYRYRVCDTCGHEFQTTELSSSELVDLRRRAYLFEREVGSATP